MIKFIVDSTVLKSNRTIGKQKKYKISKNQNKTLKKGYLPLIKLEINTFKISLNHCQKA